MKTQWFLYCPDPEDAKGSYTTSEDNGSYSGASETTTAEESGDTGAETTTAEENSYTGDENKITGESGDPGTESTTAETADAGDETNSYTGENTNTEEQSYNSGSTATEESSPETTEDCGLENNGKDTAADEYIRSGTEPDNTGTTSEESSATNDEATSNTSTEEESAATENGTDTTGTSPGEQEAAQPTDSVTNETVSQPEDSTITQTAYQPEDDAAAGTTSQPAVAAATGTTFPQEEYEAKAKDAYNKVVQNNPGIENAATATGGHSTSNEVFGEWYDKLQRLLIRLNKWSAVEEEAREFLSEYASKKVADLIKGYIPDNVQYQLNRVGLSQTNDAAIGKFNPALSRTSVDFQAAKGAANWCAQTQSKAMTEALKKYRVKVVPEWGAWFNKKTVSRNLDLKIGDYLTVVGNVTPLTGHVACFLFQDENSVYFVSGNAGGGGAPGDGTLRIDKVNTENPPAGYSYDSIVKQIIAKMNVPKQPGVNQPKTPGTVWIINAVKFSSVDFEHLNSLADDSAAMSKMGLQKI